MQVRVGVFSVEQSDLDLCYLPWYRSGSGSSWEQSDLGLYVCMHHIDDSCGSSHMSGYFGF